MSLFSRKKKVKKDSDEDNKGISKTEYKIILKEKLGSTTRTIKEFTANRLIDPSTHVVFLTNPKLKFVEIFPGDAQSHLKIEKDEIKRRIAVIENKLKQEREKDTEAINDKNLEFELMKYKAIERRYKFGNDGSYISFGVNGQPEFTFLREGSTFHPFKWDTDTTTTYTPSDNKKKLAALTLRNKETKYTSKSIVEISTVVLLIIGLILTLGNVFLGYKVYKWHDESNIAKLETKSLETLDICSQYLITNADQIKEITDKLEEKHFPEPELVVNVPPNLIP